MDINPKDILSVILGGGRGTRLFPLTKYRAKPAVPIVGKYRLVDIPISNCLNSGFNRIVILTQFNSASLNRHIYQAYKIDFFSQGFVQILAADQGMDHGDWFQGSADAVRKCLRHFSDPRLKYLLILSGDQLYTMDFRKLLRFHIESEAQITIACNPVGREETPDLGIAHVGPDFRIREFVEKPRQGEDIDYLAVDVDGRKQFLASMGIYIFNRDVLFNLLLGSRQVDFGREVIPEALSHKVTRAFVHQGYWKDIGSIKSFYEENLALTGLNPPLDFFDEDWQFFTRPRYLPMSIIDSSSFESTNIAEGVIVEKSRLARSIVGLRSVIGSGTVVEDSIIMGNDFYQGPLGQQGAPAGGGSLPPLGIGRNCLIRKAIVDKNVRIGDNVRIEPSPGRQDLENEFCVVRNGITIIPKSTVIPPGTVI